MASAFLFLSCWLFFALIRYPLSHHQNTPACGAVGPDYSQSSQFQDVKALSSTQKKGSKPFPQLRATLSVGSLSSSICAQSLPILVSFWPSSLVSSIKSLNKAVPSIFVIFKNQSKEPEREQTHTISSTFFHTSPAPDLTLLASSVTYILIHVNIHLREKRNKGEVLTLSVVSNMGGYKIIHQSAERDSVYFLSKKQGINYAFLLLCMKFNTGGFT